jgi:hypothetical protein
MYQLFFPANGTQSGEEPFRRFTFLSGRACGRRHACGVPASYSTTGGKPAFKGRLHLQARGVPITLRGSPRERRGSGIPAVRHALTDAHEAA